MNDEELEERLRSLKPRTPSADMDRRVLATLETGRRPAARQHHLWRMAAALLAGAILGYGAARLEKSGNDRSASAEPSVRVYIVRDRADGPGMMDFSPAHFEQTLKPLTIQASVREHSDI